MYQKRKLSVCFYFAFIVSINSFAQDGGWNLQESTTDAYLKDVFFINADTGWVAGFGIILNTKNGGVNWTVQDSSDVAFMSINFTDSDHGWAVGNKYSGQNGGIFHTMDGGQQWYLRDSSKYELNDVFFLNSDTGYVVGGGRSKTAIFRTVDGGTTWEDMDANGGHIYTVQFISDSVGWAAGERGCVLKTEDGGSSWSTIYLDVGLFNLVSICFINQDTGWVVGGDNIFKTIDGGQTWEPSVWQSNQFNYSCYFKDSNTGWIATEEGYENGIIINSKDAGNSWLVQNSGVISSLQSLFFIDDHTGWCVGSNGTILKTATAGLVSIQEKGASKDELALGSGLHQNFPNPFNFATTISYKLPVSSQVRLIVCNHQGQEVATLVNTKQSAGKYEINFEGRGLTSGVYFYKLEHVGGISVKKMLLVR